MVIFLINVQLSCLSCAHSCSKHMFSQGVRDLDFVNINLFVCSIIQLFNLSEPFFNIEVIF